MECYKSAPLIASVALGKGAICRGNVYGFLFFLSNVSRGFLGAAGYLPAGEADIRWA